MSIKIIRDPTTRLAPIRIAEYTPKQPAIVEIYDSVDAAIAALPANDPAQPLLRQYKKDATQPKPAGAASTVLAKV